MKLRLTNDRRRQEKGYMCILLEVRDVVTNIISIKVDKE